MTDRSAGPARTRIGWVDNHDDPRSTVAFLADIAATGRAVVVRPTPGCGDRTGVGLDLLTALGKNPDVLHRERLGDHTWALAGSWLAAGGITDVVVDRIHQLPVERLPELADLTGRAGADLWPVWSSPDLGGCENAVATLRAAGHQVDRGPLERLRAALPAEPHREGLSEPPVLGSVRLPAADFPTFRAAAQRHLSRPDFHRVDALYRAALARTDGWLAARRLSHDGPPPLLERVGLALVGWLRDEQLGPATDPGTALISLRATQAALFLHGILLRWESAALGSDPARRLAGDLTPVVARALTAMGRTDHAAAAALSLHLNEPPRYFGCFRCGDLLEDGSRLSGPEDHHHRRPSDRPEMNARPGPAGRPREVCCEGSTRLPAVAQPILAAHLAYRRSQGAQDGDPLFVHPERAGHSPAAVLREAVIRVCQRLHLDPPWLHRGPCEYGADVGLVRRVPGWMNERGLFLFQLDPGVAARVPAPRLSGDDGR